MTNTTAADLPAILTSGQVADLFGVSRMTVTRWAAEGKVPARVTPGGHYRYDRNQILEVLKKGTPAA